MRVEFDRRCSTERRHDPLQITDGTGRIVATRSGREWSEWSSELRIPGKISIEKKRYLIISFVKAYLKQVEVILTNLYPYCTKKNIDCESVIITEMF